MVLKSAFADPSEKPNILLIISDDAGYSDFGFNGSESIKTPHIDRLAASGVTFSQGYVTASVCCPSRMGLMTGRYQQRFGAECNVPHTPTPGYTEDDLGLDPYEATMGDSLREAGYRTMMVGKWHLGLERHHHPLNRGFDEFYGFLGGARSYWPYKEQDNPSKGAKLQINRRPADEAKEISYATDDFTDAAIDFMKRSKRAEEPFFVYLSYNAVHTPMEAKEEDIEQKSFISPKKRRIYAAMTKSMDENIGRVMDYLDDSGLRQNTLVAFINDNGGATSNASENNPLRGYKGSYWEGGIRIPFVLSWPEKLKAGVGYDNPVSTLDLLPTFLAAADGQHQGKPLDGVDLLPHITGLSKEQPHDYLFWRLWRVSAARHGKWKLIRLAENPLQPRRKLLSKPILIDLENDPSETANLAEANPEMVEHLISKIEEWESELAPPRWYDGEDWPKWARVQMRNHKMDTKSYQ